MPDGRRNDALRWIALTTLLCAGCAAREPAAATVEAAWRDAQGHSSPPAVPGSETAPWSNGARDIQSPTAHRSDAVVATVNGVPIRRERIVNLLVRSHGGRVLDVLAGLELAQAEAAEQGLIVSQADIHDEYDRALTGLLDPLAPLSSRPPDRAAAERVLDAVLAERNVSREEFDVVLRRNAYLRKLVKSQADFTPEQLRAEYERLYGRRVQVRHIQLATRGDVQRIKERLAASEDFGSLAARYSANPSGAAADGLLDPFSFYDERVPRVLREAAFSLKPGAVSDPIQVGEWYHILKLERVLEAEPHDIDSVREDLKESLIERTTDAQMQRLLEKLFERATIELLDPAFRGATRGKE